MFKLNSSLSKVELEIALEIYRQKYEIFRHFDRLRWQLPGLTLAIGAIVLTLARGKDSMPYWWGFCIFGFICFFSSFGIHRIRKGIKLNHGNLERISELLGDPTIPKHTKKLGATWWLCFLLFLIGIATFGYGVFQYPV
jgi:hypothetical protein